MSGEAAYVFAVLGGAAVLFASGKVRLDITAILVVIALALGGVLTTEEALSGFGSPVVMTVAALFVVGEMITRTGIAHAVGEWIARSAGANETRLTALLMVVPAFLGAVMSSTAVVAIFIPVVLNIAGKGVVSKARLLIPMSYAALISGMLTLIASTPNIVASDELRAAGYEPFGFFTFTPIGLAVLVVALLYVLLVGRKLLPADDEPVDDDRALRLEELGAKYGVFGRAFRLRVPEDSPFVGRTLGDTEIGSRYQVRVIMIEWRERFGDAVCVVPDADRRVQAGDVLVIYGREDRVEKLIDSADLERLTIEPRHLEVWSREAGMAEVMIHPDSVLVGTTLRLSAFRSKHGVTVVGVKRRGELLSDFLDAPLEMGDLMLMVGEWDRIARLKADVHDYIVMNLPEEMAQVAPSRRRAPVAVLILIAMVALSALNIVSIAMAALLAAMAAVATRTLSMEDGYRAISWSSIVLVAGLLPAAEALQKTGGVDIIVDALTSTFPGAGPYGMFTVMFFITAALGLVFSNTATAVLMVPIAIQSAVALGVEPYAFVMSVAIAATAAYATPVSTPVVTLVVEPGGYRFMDFVRVGVPLLILTWMVSLVVIPWLLPF